MDKKITNFYVLFCELFINAHLFTNRSDQEKF